MFMSLLAFVFKSPSVIIAIRCLCPTGVGGVCCQMFLGLSIGGTFSNGYFFAFHLLNIVNNNQLLSGVIKAVTQNGTSF